MGFVSTRIGLSSGELCLGSGIHLPKWGFGSTKPGLGSIKLCP